MKKIIISICLSLSLLSLTQAATLTVNTTADLDQLDGTCTLREAITAINNGANYNGCNGSAFGTADTINFALATPATITLTSVMPIIQNTVTINGLGETNLLIDGDSQHVIFVLNASGININNLTIDNGYSPLGGGVRLNSGADNAILDQLTISNSTSLRGGGFFCRGGASNVSVSNVRITDNEATENGGGLYAIACPNLSINNSLILNNTAPSGGGIGLSGTGTNSGFTLTNSTVSGNTATIGGGGLYFDDSVNATIEGSTISFNVLPFGDGAGILIGGNSDNLTLINSTVTGNSTPNGVGGGIWLGPDSVGTNIINTTISSNETEGVGSGIFSSGGSSFSLSNSIVAGNTATTTITHLEIFNIGTILSQENNILGSNENIFADAFFGVGLGTGDILATSTLDAAGTPNPNSYALTEIIESLANNGGPTLTHNLASNSPAINAGSQAVCNANGINQDQRGENRDGQCDIGSVELFSESESCYVVKAANDNVVVFCL